jgi:hypothetical protein
MASQAYLSLSKTHSPAEAASLLTQAHSQGLLAHHLQALKLLKSLNINEVFHHYLASVAQLPSTADQQQVYSLMADAQLGHYAHTMALFSLAKLSYAQGDYIRANEAVQLININKINPVEWHLDSLGLIQLKHDIYRLVVSLSDKLQNFDKFDEYLKKIHELLMMMSGPTASSLSTEDTELYVDLDRLHTFILLKLDKFSEVFKKLYKSKQFNELYYILLLFNVNYIEDITMTPDFQHSPISPVLQRMREAKLVYYDTYINCLKFLLHEGEETAQDAVDLQEHDKNDKEEEIKLGLTRVQILDNFKIVILRHNISCISQIYDNISLTNLKGILQSDDDGDNHHEKEDEYALSDEVFEKVLYDSITSGSLSAQIDDIEQVIQFDQGNSANVVDPEWNDHIVDSCLLLDKIIAST